MRIDQVAELVRYSVADLYKQRVNRLKGRDVWTVSLTKVTTSTRISSMRTRIQLLLNATFTDKEISDAFEFEVNCMPVTRMPEDRADAVEWKLEVDLWRKFEKASRG